MREASSQALGDRAPEAQEPTLGIPGFSYAGPDWHGRPHWNAEKTGCSSRSASTPPSRATRTSSVQATDIAAL
eukprot:366123-Pyramimonas_sp.AAC.1